MNALAAAACAHAAGIAPQAIAAGLAAFRPYTGRLQVKTTPQGATVIDDSYNANPDSVRAAIDVLAAAPGATVLVLGDMGEVGDDGPDFHSEIGRYARERGVGGAARAGRIDGAHGGGLRPGRAALRDAGRPARGARDKTRRGHHDPGQGLALHAHGAHRGGAVRYDKWRAH